MGIRARAGWFITFEGNEGCGKSTQIDRLAGWMREQGMRVRVLREPGGTPIGEEIRYTLKHSEENRAMTYEAELLLMAASRAQLVREVIQPSLAQGEVVLCDRFHDSTTVYQGYARGLPLDQVNAVNRFAVGETYPDLTLLLRVSLEVSEQRRAERARPLAEGSGVVLSVDRADGEPARDRFEEEGRDFFARVERGYDTIAADEPGRIKVIQADRSVEDVHEFILDQVGRLLSLER